VKHVIALDPCSLVFETVILRAYFRRFLFLAAVKIHVDIFWVTMPCSVNGRVPLFQRTFVMEFENILLWSYPQVSDI
jgi:hypothetical protein